MAYDPYNAIKNITDYKANYDTAKATGQNFDQYHTSATSYYDELKANGYGGLADQLSKSNTSQAMKLLDQYAPKQTASNPAPNYNVGNANTDNYINQLLGIASGKTQITPSAATQGVLDSFHRTDDLLNGSLKYDANGNVVGGLNVDYYNTGKNQLDYINNFDYTKQPYFDSIMSTYKLGGEDAANGEYAGGAASNGGNIDSYAAANANRQQLAFTNAGHQAALAAAQQNQDNWKDVYAQMGGHLTDMGSINSANLGYGAKMYGDDAAYAQSAVNNLTSYFNNESNNATNYAMNESNNATTLEQQRLINQLNESVANIEATTQRYGYDSAERQNTLNNETQKLIAQIGADADRYTAELNAETSRYGVDKDYAATMAKLYNSGNNKSTQNPTPAKNEETKLTAEDWAVDFYNSFITGDPEVAKLKSWDELKTALVGATGSFDMANQAINILKTNAPNLFQNYLTPVEKTAKSTPSGTRAGGAGGSVKVNMTR